VAEKIFLKLRIMKTKLRLMLVIGLLLAVPSMTLAVTGSTSSGYNEAKLYEALNFTATLSTDGSSVKTNWDAYAPAGFNYYKVVRSTTNPDPVYPDDSYIKAISDSNTTTHIDNSVPSGKVYYRVCSIVKPNRYCSSVVIIQNGDVADAGDVKPVLISAEPVDPAGIELNASMGTDGVVLKWTVNGEAPQGFKLAKSYVNGSPTYPVMDGDMAYYLNQPSQRSYVDKKVQAGKTVYYRVCQYVDGKCLSYSNPVKASVPQDFAGVTYTYEKTTAEKEPVPEKLIANDDEYYALKKEIAALKEKVAQLETFIDVQQHKYETAIDYLREKGIVQGYDDGSYKPNNTINRAEFMKIVMGEKYGTELTSEQVDCFNDVGKDWYAAYVCLGKNKGIISGYDDGSFKPGSQISFVEAAKILSNVYGLDLGDDGYNWYEKYVRALQSDGYIPSSVGSLSKPITRAEMAELIWRIKEQKKQQDSIKLLSEPVIIEEGMYEGWTTYEGSDFRFLHPGWYQGEKWGRVLLTEELDFYQNLNTPNYLAVDSYVSVYDVAGTDLNTSIWAEHPLVSSQPFTINGVTALKRHFRAPRGTVVNGRTTGENENITVYSYLVNGHVTVLEYFNAFGTENKNVEVFDKIASSFGLK